MPRGVREKSMQAIEIRVTSDTISPPLSAVSAETALNTLLRRRREARGKLRAAAQSNGGEWGPMPPHRVEVVMTVYAQCTVMARHAIAGDPSGITKERDRDMGVSLLLSVIHEGAALVPVFAEVSAYTDERRATISEIRRATVLHDTPEMRNLLVHTDRSVRVLAKAKYAKIIAYCSAASTSVDVEVRREFAWRVPIGTAFAQALLDDPDMYVRARFLCRLPDDSPERARALSGSSEELWYSALALSGGPTARLGGVRGPSRKGAIAIRTAQSKHQDVCVRLLCLDQLFSCGGSEAVDAASDFLLDSEPAVSRRAFEIVGMWGPCAPYYLTS